MKIGLGTLLYLCGILHDMGKLQSDFNDYVHGVGRICKGQIDHCYAGAKYIQEL